MVICLKLDCSMVATTMLVPQYGRRSMWCREHGEVALAVEQIFENRQSEGARLLPEDRMTLPRARRAAS